MDNRTIRLSDATDIVRRWHDYVTSNTCSTDVDYAKTDEELAVVLAALSALPAVGGWLPIEESDGNLCQVTDGGYVVTAFKQDGHWVAGWQNETMAIQFVLSPTHYMPLPAPPIE